tara:strand:- start:1365 stop:2237 length:873 start_codon:yes stop_codon:yes gene_type:complete
MQNNIFICSLLVFTATIFFVTNDAIINFLSPKGITFYHFIFYGSPTFFIVPLYLVFKGKLIYNIKCTNYFIPIIRSIIFLPLPFFTFISLKNITLPEYTVLNMSAPIFAIISSILFLNEKINNLILLSLLFGLIGVYLVVQPGFDNFNPFYLLVLFAAFLITTTSTIVNKYHYVTTPIGFFIYGGILTHLLSIILFLFDPLFIDIKTFILITVSGIVINLAICFMTIAFHKSIKFYGSLFCLCYFQILWSVIFGIVFFDEHLNFLAIFGAIFIILSGLISIPAQYKQIKN